MRRIVSIWLPHFPLERLRQQEPGAVPPDTDPAQALAVKGPIPARRVGKQKDLPFVLVASEAGRLSVGAANADAERAGIRPGLGLADARAIVPGLASRPAEPERDRQALTRLARWCARYGPAFNTDGSDGLWIDTTGVAHLYGGEEQLLADLCRRFARFGLTARPGLGDGLGAASALARFASSAGLPARIAPPGSAGPALAELPVEALRLEPATIRLLLRLGLKRIGQLYALPRAALQHRFASRQAAEAVLLRLDQALGRRQEPLTPLSSPPEHLVRAAFPEPLIAAQGLETALAELIEDLCRSLAKADRGARRLCLTLYRSDGTRALVRAGLSRPSRSGPHIFKLLGEKLQSIDAGFGIDLMLLGAPVSEPLAAAQKPLVALGRSGEAGRESESLAALIDRLTGRLGAGGIVRLQPRASHLPERAEALVAALIAPPATAAPAGHPRQAKRPPLLLARPEPVEVVAEVPEGPPQRLRWRRSLHSIVRAEGPERIAPEWWHELDGDMSAPRDYYAIEDDTGARFWVFREGLYGAADTDDARAPAWYLHGFFG